MTLGGDTLRTEVRARVAEQTVAGHRRDQDFPPRLLRRCVRARALRTLERPRHALSSCVGFTADGKVPPGLYAVFLRRAIGYLKKAQAVAEPAQAHVISDLIGYYETGESGCLAAVRRRVGTQDISPVDFANGFVEVYRDPRGAKGSSAAFRVDHGCSQSPAAINRSSPRMPQYFEERAPVGSRSYRKKQGVYAAHRSLTVETTIESRRF
jgi:hypothetical protein